MPAEAPTTDTSAIARRISSLCESKWDRYYTLSKLKTDPIYAGVFRELEERRAPLLDIGCGMGLLAFYLRERGWQGAVEGLDYDERKIDAGRRMVAAGGYRGISLSMGDARTDLPEHRGDVTVLDILQFFARDEQQRLLRAAASRVAPGGKFIIRSGLRERNLRFFITQFMDFVARGTFWMKSAPVHYPTAALFRETLEPEGFSVSLAPLWGKTPFNNYLVVARRPAG
jgi:SAM-dependent methyltransferase